MWKALGILELLALVVAWTFMISLLVRSGAENLIVALLLLLLYKGHDGVLALIMGRKGHPLAKN